MKLSFATRAGLVALAAAAVPYWPIALGRVPFPVSILQGLPATEVPGRPAARPAQAHLGDLVTQAYPWRVFEHRTVRAGHPPLWNPHILLGTPLAANLQSACFYPLGLGRYILPVAVDWALGFPLRTVLACLFTALLARRLGCTAAASLAAGVTFAASGFLVGWQGWSHADSAVWLPAALWGVHRLAERPSGARTGEAGVLFAMPVLAGHPEVALLVALSAAGFAVVLLTRRGMPGPQRRALAARFVLAGALAAGIAAVQILPSLEWLGSLVRGLHTPARDRRPLRDALAVLSREAGPSPSPLGFEVPEAMTYAGIGTLLLAPLALFQPRRREAVFFAAMVGTAVQAVYWFGPVDRLWPRVPLLSSIVRDRAIVLVELGLAMLAALGLTAISGDGAWTRRRRAAVLATLALGLAAVAWGLDRLGAEPGLGEADPFAGPRGLLASIALAAVGASLATAAVVTPRARGVLLAAAVMVTCVDVTSFARGYMPMVRPAEVFPETPILRYLRSLDPLSRTVFVGVSAPANVEMVFGLSSPTGYEYAMTDVARLLGPLTGDAEPRLFLSELQPERVVAASDRRLDLAGVRYLVATLHNSSAATLGTRPDRFRLVFDADALRVYENVRALRRAFLVPEAGVEVAPREAAFERVTAPGFEPERTVVVSEAPSWPADGGPTEGPARVTGWRLEPDEVVIRARVPGRHVLVLSDVRYPGWNAYVDGRRAPLVTADFLFRGVALGRGEHEVRFAYEPASVGCGAAISAGSVLAVGLIVLRGRRRRALPAAA